MGNIPSSSIGFSRFDLYDTESVAIVYKSIPLALLINTSVSNAPKF